MNISRIVLVMGPSGSGKSSVGAALAHRLAATFLDADDFCPTPAKAKMAAGIPLSDEDRWPWLDRLNQELHRRPEPVLVLACSAHKETYRQRLFSGLRPPAIVYLNGPPELIRERLSRRPNHFMPPSLLDSQLALMEKPAQCLAPEIDQSVDAIVAEALAFVSLAQVTLQQERSRFS